MLLLFQPSCLDKFRFHLWRCLGGGKMSNSENGQESPCKATSAHLGPHLAGLEGMKSNDKHDRMDETLLILLTMTETF
jgi:hypothetical protein